MRHSIFAVGIAAMLLTGCGALKLGSDGKGVTPIAGDRKAVLVNERDLVIDPATAAAPFALPPQTANANWAQSGGNASKYVGHAALGETISQAWSVSIGEGSSRAARLGDGPVVSNGRVYTMDTQSVVRAFDLRNGGAVWSAAVGQEKGNSASLYGGGVAASDDGTRIYATNGLGYVVALDANSGTQIWQVKPAGPMRGAPTVDGDRVYVTTQDNQLFALKAADGATEWSNAAALEIAGVFGAGAPASARGTVVAGFSSGELNAYRYENGRQVWQDALSRTSISTSVSSLSDIDADPVIANDMVFALGKGGRLVALDLFSGNRVWEANMAGASTPWVTADYVYAMSDAGQLIAFARDSGKIRWINQLPRWGNEKKKQDPIFYAGPVLAGGRLFVAGTNGALIEVRPSDGTFLTQREVRGAVRFQPVVAGGTLLLLSEDGRLTAFR